jgi:WD40 repeat protein
MPNWGFAGHPIFSPDGKTIAGALTNGGLQFWETATFAPSLKLETGGLPVGFTPDGQRLLVLAASPPALQWWDVSRQAMLTNIPLGLAPDDSYSDAVSSDHKLLAVARRNGIAVCSTDTGEVLYQLSPGGGVRNVEFSPDCRALAAGCFNATAVLWDLATRKPLWTVGGFRPIVGVVGTVAFSPDGKLFAAGSWDNTIKVCRAGTGEELLALEGHKAAVTRVAFLSDGKTLASTSDDHTVKLWNLATGREMLTLPRRTESVALLCFSPDGETFATGELNAGTLQLWRGPFEASPPPGIAR